MTTARTSSRSVASRAAARISSCTCTLRAFIFGRSSRMVPTPLGTSRRTHSPIAATSLSGLVPGMLPASARMRCVTPGIWTHLGQRARVWPGRNWPLGATWSPDSTNFAVYSPNATECWVCVFDDEGVETRHQLTERSLGIWHGAIPEVRPGTQYGYRVDGP